MSFSANERVYIYGNWAAYDELSDGIQLTEELALTQLDHVLRFRENGVRFDAYLMDAFWFAPDGAYRKWRKPNWPDGPDRWLDRCRENNLIPGLWFTANTLCHIDAAPRWQDSVDANNWGMCLFQGGYFPDFLEVLDLWYERGIRIFKIDFADFNAVPAGSEIPKEEARPRNISAFRAGIAQFRRKHPDAVFMAFNGFEERECMDRTHRPLDPPCIDKAWLDIFDSIYCGDPRPADVPAWSFWRSVDIYSDHMTRVFEAAGIPLDRIDNCGFMAGDTGTCYRRKSAGWQAMLLLSLARGGRLHVAYGDLGLFSDEDSKWWAAAQKLFDYQGPATSFGGLPGKAEPYGWQCGSVSVVVNPSLFTALNPPKGSADVDDFQLPPGQIAIISDDLPPEFKDIDGPVAPFWQIETTAVDAEAVSAEISFTADNRLHYGYRYKLLVRRLTAEGEAGRTWPKPNSQPPLIVTLTTEAGTTELPWELPWPIWSGTSWATYTLPDISGPIEITVRDNELSDGQLDLKAWATSIK